MPKESRTAEETAKRNRALRSGPERIGKYTTVVWARHSGRDEQSATRYGTSR
jgi:hypothetical protein